MKKFLEKQWKSVYDVIDTKHVYISIHNCYHKRWRSTKSNSFPIIGIEFLQMSSFQASFMVDFSLLGFKLCIFKKL